VKRLDQLPVEAGCFYVMDRGYLDFSRLRRVARHGGFFVVRSRRRLGFALRHSFPADKTTGLRCDQKIALTNPHSRKACPEPLRPVGEYDPAQEILGPLEQQLCRARAGGGRPLSTALNFSSNGSSNICAFEDFGGVSPNAVQCQIWSTLGVYLLVAILKKEIGWTQSLHEILQILSIHPFEQSPIRELLIKTAAEVNMDAQQNLFDLNTL
jgi:hypothetical protein